MNDLIVLVICQLFACLLERFSWQVGDKVQKGQVLCIIEAMKLMNEIEVSFIFYSCTDSELLSV